MSLWHLVLQELRLRRGSFVLGVLAVGTAVACVVAAVQFLERHDLRTEQRAHAQQERLARELSAQEVDLKHELELQDLKLQQRLAALENDFRKITLGLGFNLLILPKTQQLGDLYADDFAAQWMPEEYAEKLVRAKLASINHVLPLLQQKLKWEERGRTILLCGTRGEVASFEKEAKKPLLDLVPAGQAVAGYELARSLGLRVGEELKLRGRTFTLARCQPERGNKDDITLWINLAEAQKMLQQEGRINAILALECNCEADRLARIRADVASVLPDTQVIEFSGQALARAEARNRAAAEARDARAQAGAEARARLERSAAEARAAVAREREGRALERSERERLFATLAPVIAVAAALGVALLTWSNVRGRVREIGLLGALGVPSQGISRLFLTRALLTGLVGAAPGFLAGWLGMWLGEEQLTQGPPLGPCLDVRLLLAALVLTPLLAALAGWIPALLAAQLEPAEALRER